MRDYFIESLDALEAERVRLCDELETLGEVVARARERRGDCEGFAVAALEVGSLRAGDGLLEALARFGRAFASTRAQSVRTLVEDEAWTITRIARVSGYARQRISRMYHAAKAR